MASKYDIVKKELFWAERNFHRAVIVDDGFLDYVSSLKAKYSELLIEIFPLCQSAKIKKQTWDHYKKVYDIFTEKAEVVWQEYSQRDKKNAIQPRYTFDGKEIKKSYYIPLQSYKKYLSELSDATEFVMSCNPSVRSDLEKVKSDYAYHHQGHLYLLSPESGSEIGKKVKQEQWNQLIQMSSKYELLYDDVIFQSKNYKSGLSETNSSRNIQIEYPSNEAIEKWDNLFAEAKYSRTFLWAIALIKQFVQPDKVEVSFMDLADEMISSSWKLMANKELYLYQFDTFRQVLLSLKKHLKLNPRQNHTDIYNVLQSEHDSPLYTKCVGELLSGVPWGFLRGWIPDSNIDGIEQLSKKYTNECMYAIISSKNGYRIRIHPTWKNFIVSEYITLLTYVDNAFKKLIMKYNPKNEELHVLIEADTVLF